ncbi:ABC transporter permease [Pelagibacterium lentulum]|uniref:ABC transporter permease n=1 Tax=Pelagibacterium lentulum TaxID=2029865 RepID=A0A916R6I0_9HYPH|nr:ABC transporter permease [Pelagibacterium lentulum]GGA39868.1 ABC transporter permease [Pelagibacterium lentulum]
MSAPRIALPRWVDVVLLPVLNVSLAFLIGGIVVLAVGENPIEAVRIMFYGAFGYGYGFGFTLYYTTNFVFAGLAVALAYHAGLFNIGGEGQAYVAGLGAILVALAVAGLHWALALPLIMIASALFGGIWALIPGYLQAKRGSHVVITTIMMNFIATSLMSYLISRVLKPPHIASDESERVDAMTRVPFLSEWIPMLRNTPVNISFFLAIAALVGVYILIWRTKFGYALRTMGHSGTAARYAGMSNAKLIMITMAISGALAGMIAVNDVAGAHGRLLLNYVAGTGFVGIAVAFMGKAHPIGVGLSALLFGVLYQGGQELAFTMPAITREMILTIQALVILFTGAMSEMLRRPVELAFIFSRLRGHDPDTQPKLAAQEDK